MAIFVDKWYHIALFILKRRRRKSYSYMCVCVCPITLKFQDVAYIVDAVVLYVSVAVEL